MKYSYTLIILLFSINNSSIQAQILKPKENHHQRKHEKVSSEPSIQNSLRQSNSTQVESGNYPSLNQSIEREVISKGNTKPHGFITQNKVKSRRNNIPEEDYYNIELKEISNSYWYTQKEIKKAKLDNNLILIDQLESNSLSQRLSYISVFESLNSTEDVSPEQISLYHSFKKDFEDE
ncbi:MAG: hypothetical protein DBW72_05445 [Flavobacteriales bacterium]|nr:MAG: hypothetical protein DBW72_05445 [Flavobacteriales bacterium]